MYQTYCLKNGLKVLLIPRGLKRKIQKKSFFDQQTATVLILTRVGSKYEQKEINGISHFLEHMLFKGTHKRPGAKEVAETIEKMGGVFNAFTSTEYTGYYAKVASEFLDLAIEWINDIFTNSIINQEETIRERGVIIEEINMYNDDPMSKVRLMFQELLYGNQPAGWPISGTKETVSKIDNKLISEYFKKHYTAKNTIVCVSGDFDPQKIKKIISFYFSGMLAGKDNKKPRVCDKQIKPAIVLNQKKTDQVHICLGVRAYDMFHPQRYALILLNEVLGGMMSSRLFTEIRERRGWAYYISSELESETDSGFLLIKAGLDTKNFLPAIEIMLKECKKISQDGISDEELSKAKKYFRGKFALSLESSDSLAMFCGLQQILKKRIETPTEIFQKIEKVKKSDILKVGKDIFRRKYLNLAAVGLDLDKKLIFKKFKQL